MGTALGRTKLASIALPHAGNRRWPKTMFVLVFHHGRDERTQGQAAVAYLDIERLEAFFAFDDSEAAPRFVKEVDRIMKKLGIVVDVIDDLAHRRRVVKQFQRYFED